MREAPGAPLIISNPAAGDGFLSAPGAICRHVLRQWGSLGYNDPMKIERLLQVNIAVLTVVGTLLLGLGQENPMLPALSLFAAVTSIYFTDVMGWFRLHRMIANLAAVGALFISLREFDVFGGDSTSQLGAIASLLVYLQFVLLYQEKNERVYWQLVVLSLLQVVVAAALHLGVEFGALLVVYMFAALSAMSLLFVYHHIEAVQEERRLLVEEPRLRGPMAPWAPTAAPLAVRQCSETELARALLGWPFLLRLMATGTATLVLAVIAFYATPRLSNAVWRGAQRGVRTTGFNREIRLGELGELLQNDASAMRVKFIDRQGNAIALADAPYLRGASLSQYVFNGNEGKWTQAESPNPQQLRELGSAASAASAIVMQFTLEPSRSSVLFSAPPAWISPATPNEVRYDPLSDQLVRLNTGPLPLRLGEYRYEILTTGVVERRQVRVWPQRPMRGYAAQAAKMDLRRLPWEYEEVRDLSRRVVAESEAPRRNPYQVAKALEGHFHRPGRYRYALDQTDLPPRPPGMDPIVHFLVNHRTGHCEYFASGLVLLLRAQNIPARVVVGYRASEFNTFGRFYNVRQLDAHAWVEASVERAHLPPELQAEVSEDVEWVWLRLDPTPPAFRGGNSESLFTQFSQATRYLEAVWNDHVLGLNSSRQKQAIYAPLLDRAKATFDHAERMGRELANRLTPRNIVRALGLDEPDARYPWKTLVACLLLAASLALLLRAAWRHWAQRGGQLERRLRRRLERWLGPAGWTLSPAFAEETMFFRRLEKLLARRRFRRRDAQTQREFANQVAGELGMTVGEVGPLLNRLVEFYYRVRFGKRPLDTAEAEAIENTLNQLEQTLAKRHS